MNIGTAVVVLGVIGAGYWFFVRKEAPAPEAGVIVGALSNAASVAEAGAEITSTLKELEGLKRAVASSTAFFSEPAFRNLNDISVAVSPEPVGRDNPFELTGWKIKEKALEQAASKAGASRGSTQGVQSVQGVPAEPSGI